jgi:hypothetical protein
VGVCDDGDKAGGADDGAAGAAGGGDMRRVQLAECCKHAEGNYLLSHTFESLSLHSSALSFFVLQFAVIGF